MTCRAWSGRARAFARSDLRATSSVARSVPELTSEAATRTLTVPGASAGSGTSTSSRRPSRRRLATCLMRLRIGGLGSAPAAASGGWWRRCGAHPAASKPYDPRCEGRVATIRRTVAAVTTGGAGRAGQQGGRSLPGSAEPTASIRCRIWERIDSLGGITPKYRSESTHWAESLPHAAVNPRDVSSPFPSPYGWTFTYRRASAATRRQRIRPPYCAPRAVNPTAIDSSSETRATRSASSPGNIGSDSSCRPQRDALGNASASTPSRNGGCSWTAGV